jgi:hypothetical protein
MMSAPAEEGLAAISEQRERKAKRDAERKPSGRIADTLPLARTRRKL